jgi:hypothetical protein
MTDLARSVILATRGLGVDMSDADSLEAAQLCHNLAVVLGAASELLQERAGTILASVAARGPHDRNRVEWAVELAGDMTARGRFDEAERVLVAALALSEGLFGGDDEQSIATRQRLARARSLMGLRRSDDNGASD